jgi:hypothetical protein
MTDWSHLSHAYGRADNVPALLEQLEPDPAAECWEELWSHLYHDGTVYSASFAALPALTSTAAGWEPEDRVMVLSLAGAILAGARQPHGAGDVLERYAAEISALLRLCEQSLRSPALADDPSGFVHLLQAALAFENVPIWDENLDGLIDEEFQVRCPGCDAELFIAMGEYGFFASGEDYATEVNARRTPLVPAHPAELDGLASRLHSTADDAGHKTVAEGLTYLFGTAACTECATTFTVADRVAR